MSEESLYREQLMELYRNPSNRGELACASDSFEGMNRSCGDRFSFQAQIEEDIVKDIAFEGSGCAISIAATSLVTDAVKGKTCEEILSLTTDDVLTLLGLELGPNRIKCATLSLQAIQEYLRGVK